MHGNLIWSGRISISVCFGNAKSDKATVNRIRIGIEGLKINPPKGDIKLMQGFDDGRQRLRIGKYRIIFKRLLDGTYEIIYIMDIGSRGDIYK